MLQMPLMLICPIGGNRCPLNHVTGTHLEQENSSAAYMGFPHPSQVTSFCLVFAVRAQDVFVRG